MPWQLQEQLLCIQNPDAQMTLRGSACEADDDDRHQWDDLRVLIDTDVKTFLQARCRKAKNGCPLLVGLPIRNPQSGGPSGPYLLCTLPTSEASTARMGTDLRSPHLRDFSRLGLRTDSLWTVVFVVPSLLCSDIQYNRCFQTYIGFGFPRLAPWRRSQT